MSRLDLVWDSYVVDSLKATARVKRGKGVCRHVVDSAPIPANWQNFLRVDLNKKELFSFLSKALVHSFKQDKKELVVTDGDQVVCVPPQQDAHLLVPCNHAEADSRMMLHVAHAVDTDVAIMVAETLPADNEVWIAFGSGKHL